MGPVTWVKLLAAGRRFWYVAPIVALAVALALTRGTLASTKTELSEAKRQYTELKASSRVTRAALDGALAKIAEQNAAAQAAARRLEADREEAASDRARLAERYRGTAERVAALEASAKAKPTDPCKPSTLAVDALKDL